MGLSERLRERNRGAIMYECQDCGTRLPSVYVEAERCPYCGPTVVVCY